MVLVTCLENGMDCKHYFLTIVHMHTMFIVLLIGKNLYLVLKIILFINTLQASCSFISFMNYDLLFCLQVTTCISCCF